MTTSIDLRLHILVTRQIHKYGIRQQKDPTVFCVHIHMYLDFFLQKRPLLSLSVSFVEDCQPYKGKYTVCTIFLAMMVEYVFSKEKNKMTTHFL